MHLAVALPTQVPKPLVMHLFVLGRCDEPLGGFRLIYPMIAANSSAARLGFTRGRTQGVRSALGMLQPTAILDWTIICGGGTFNQDVRLKALHDEAPFKTSAIWMYFIGKPARSAHPC